MSARFFTFITAFPDLLLSRLYRHLLARFFFSLCRIGGYRIASLSFSRYPFAINADRATRNTIEAETTTSLLEHRALNDTRASTILVSKTKVEGVRI